MKTIKQIFTNEIVINKSQFITNLFPVTTPEEVNEYLSMTRKKYYDATHNCYAYILGQHQEIQKASDDGEPQKTAGFPMIDVLKKKDMTNILAITTRYFGGILLGAGGLVRAYSSSVSEALDNAEIYEYRDYLKISIEVSYSVYNNLASILSNYQIIDTLFADNVTIYLGVNPNEAKDFINTVTNLSSGKAIISEYDIYQMEILIKHNES